TEEEEVRRRGDEHIAEEQEEPLPPATEVAKADVIGHASDESKNRTREVQREGLGRDPPMTVGIDSVLTLFPRRLWSVRVPAVTELSRWMPRDPLWLQVPERLQP